MRVPKVSLGGGGGGASPPLDTKGCSDVMAIKLFLMRGLISFL